ncbi:MAG: hypothetical protein QOA70_06800 [Nitrososphaeraceae archaeon]|nr:hypothetical protein [Nitrososphaeraceae archaeon]
MTYIYIMYKRIVILKHNNETKYYSSVKLLCEDNPGLTLRPIQIALKEKGIYWKDGYCVTREKLIGKKEPRLDFDFDNNGIIKFK